MQSLITPVSSKYGAPMGRYSKEYLETESGKIYLRKVPLDSGGYDRGGAYWGLGPTLWECSDQESNGFIFRASNRESAKAYILSMFPDAKFYR